MKTRRFFHCTLTFALSLCLLVSGCAKQEEVTAKSGHSYPEYFYHPEWLSNKLDERFQQIFYYSLDNPTVDKPFPPDSDPAKTIPTGSGSDSYLFHSCWFPEQNLIKGALFFIEPPNSFHAVGVDRNVVRGIYDLTGGETKKDNTFPLESLSMELELTNCTIHDLTLGYKSDFRLQNQMIPLAIEESDGIMKVTADFSQVKPLLVNQLENNLIISGVLTYQGEDYKFNTRI